jgi:putative iron-dependent peroxidase
VESARPRAGLPLAEPTITATPQPGIFALGTRAHYHLEFEVRPAATDAEIVAALAKLHEPAVTAGGTNLVLGFGADLWGRLAPADMPVGLHDFDPIDGLDGTHAPATQHDLWVWIHGTGEDVALDVARAVGASLAPVAELRLDQPCFVYQDSRDLTGFVDGTANPHIEQAPAVAMVPAGEPGAGGCYVITQRWVHDLTGFAALDVAAQERVFGRTKPDSVELDDEAKPADAHIARVEIHDAGGDERPIFRRSTPYGTVEEAGIYFLAFSADLSRFTDMLANMFGTSGDGIRDRLTDFSTPVSGSFFFAPSLESLATVLAGPDPDPDPEAG